MKRKSTSRPGSRAPRTGAPDPNLQRATELFHAGRTVEAARLVDAAVARNPKDPNALRIKALILLKGGLMLDAQRILDRAWPVAARCRPRRRHLRVLGRERLRIHGRVARAQHGGAALLGAQPLVEQHQLLLG